MRKLSEAFSFSLSDGEGEPPSRFDFLTTAVRNDRSVHRRHASRSVQKDRWAGVEREHSFRKRYLRKRPTTSDFGISRAAVTWSEPDCSTDSIGSRLVGLNAVCSAAREGAIVEAQRGTQRLIDCKRAIMGVGAVAAEERERPAVVGAAERQPRAEQRLAVGDRLRIGVVDRADMLIGHERDIGDRGPGQR